MPNQIPIAEKRYILAEKIDETPEVLIVRFAPEDETPCAFDPGMFMMIFGVDSDGKRYTGRAFSIASDPSSPMMEFFTIKEPAHGDNIGRSHFADAKIGDPFFLRGPNGQFRFDPAKDSKVLFVAGGTGLAPFMSMLRHMAAIGAKTDIVMLYSVKYPTEIIRRMELEDLEKSLNMKMTVTVTRPAPSDGWNGQTGHVDSDMVKKYAPDFNDRMCYVCGPLNFVKAANDALSSLGIKPERISADVWG